MSFGYNTAIDDGWGMNVVGYPGDKPFRTMWRMFGKLVDASNQLFKYYIDTNHGQSGAPVYLFTPPSFRRIYGVHGGAVWVSQSALLVQILSIRYAVILMLSFHDYCRKQVLTSPTSGILTRYVIYSLIKPQSTSFADLGGKTLREGGEVTYFYERRLTCIIEHLEQSSPNQQSAL